MPTEKEILEVLKKVKDTSLRKKTNLSGIVQVYLLI
jgi:hypothetical protein